MDIKYLRILWLNKKIKELKEKIRIKRLGCIVLVVLSSGCIYNNPAVIPNPTINNPATKEQYEQNLLITERNKIFAVYDKYIPNNIILAYEKIYGNTFDIAKNYLQYNKEDNLPTYDGFWIWLIKNIWYKDTFEKRDEFGIGKWLIDNRFNDNLYQDVKKNYELLEKMR